MYFMPQSHLVIVNVFLADGAVLVEAETVCGPWFSTSLMFTLTAAAGRELVFGDGFKRMTLSPKCTLPSRDTLKLTYKTTRIVDIFKRCI